jgi:GxxExxY protein
MLASLGSINQITSRIIQAAIEVHRQLGPGLLESIYLTCLCYERQLSGLRVECECPIAVFYKGVRMACSFRLDLIVEGLVIVELKAIEKVLPVHEAQLLTQLKLAGKPAGLLLNFNVPLMKHGVTRLLNRTALEALQAT